MEDSAMAEHIQAMNDLPAAGTLLLCNLAANNYKILSIWAYTEVKNIFCISQHLLVRYVGVTGVGLTEALTLLPLLPDTVLSFLRICGELLAY